MPACNVPRRRTRRAIAPRELDRWAERIRIWEEGGAPADLPRISAADVGRPNGRDCFIYMIDGAKEKAPAAARALIDRLALTSRRGNNLDPFAAAAPCAASVA